MFEQLGGNAPCPEGYTGTFASFLSRLPPFLPCCTAPPTPLRPIRPRRSTSAAIEWHTNAGNGLGLNGCIDVDECASSPCKDSYICAGTSFTLYSTHLFGPVHGTLVCDCFGVVCNTHALPNADSTSEAGVGIDEYVCTDPDLMNYIIMGVFIGTMVCLGLICVRTTAYYTATASVPLSSCPCS